MRWDLRRPKIYSMPRSIVMALTISGFRPVWCRWTWLKDLPAGVQLVGRRFREDVILDAMAAIEQRAGCLVKRLWAR